jgi:hypothetical protein
MNHTGWLDQIGTDRGPTDLAAFRTLAINTLFLTGGANIAAGLRNTPGHHSYRWPRSGSCDDDVAEPLGHRGHRASLSGHG